MNSISIRLVLTAITLFVSSQAHATYMIINYNQPSNQPSMNPALRTHFVISSKGNDLGYGPQLAGLTKPEN